MTKEEIKKYSVLKKSEIAWMIILCFFSGMLFYGFLKYCENPDKNVIIAFVMFFLSVKIPYDFFGKENSDNIKLKPN